jgi:hypothetical protein
LVLNDYLTHSLGARIPQANIEMDVLTTSANNADEFVTVTSLPKAITAVDTTLDLLTIEGESSVFVLGDMVRLTAGTIGGLSSATDYYIIPYQRQKTVRARLATSLQNALAGTYINLTSGTTGVLTKIAEPRYHGGGVLKSDVEPAQNIQEVVLSMAGTLAHSGGKWHIYSGYYKTPTISFDMGDIVSDIQTATKISKQERFNRIQGSYNAHQNDGNPSDYPLVKNDSYATQDGEIIKKTRDLAFVQRPIMAQRVAKCEMERMRQEFSFSAKFMLTAFKTMISDNIMFSFPRYGWSDKVFEVVSWGLTVSNDAPVIDMVCRETAATCWDWNNGEETATDPAPNSTLPSIRIVQVPSSLAVYPVEIETATGDVTYKFNLVWAASTDQYVVNGGRYEVQFKESAETEYRPSFFLDGEQTTTDIYQVNPDTQYDARVRAVNLYGVRSNWVTILSFTASSPSGVSVRLDYELFSNTPTSFLDYGLFSDSVTSSLDYGSFV